ncbi:hypothetical protein NSA11_10955 [Lactobacillus taiwanensis]|uniref:hypothetical protein n=1 Tax=Lactobacillus taiwanensis TaxID=508451 RepID=UPI00214B0A2D|nr:hypothetical protein [Lactobacillus taiwanensis]MCR1904381.1 hypothetical protein [Lactobacillus taiwanensis]
MTNKDKSTEKLRELIETKQIYRVHFTYGNEMHMEVTWVDGLVMPKDGAKKYCLVDFSIPVNRIEEVDEVKL